MDSRDGNGWMGSLRRQNETLRQENGDLKLMLRLMKENHSLRSKLYSTNGFSFCATDGPTDHGTSEVKGGGVTWDDTLDEGKFTGDLLTMAPHRTSSPLETTTAKKSILKSPRLDEDQQERFVQQVKDPERLVGEMAFQLDRRILALVFQEQQRLYGFTVQNICHKITQVCTHPVSGKVDESLQAQLTERYLEVLELLGRFGYSATLHAPFTELLVTTYGILRQRPDPRNAWQQGYGNPDALRHIIVNTVPAAQVKDALVLHTCLSYLAKQDGKALFLW